MQKFSLIILVSFGLVLAGCSFPKDEVDQPGTNRNISPEVVKKTPDIINVKPKLDQEFTVAVGKEAEIGSEQLFISYTVLEDDRCRVDEGIQCDSPGEAWVRITVRQRKKEEASEIAVEETSHPDRPVNFLNYRIILKELPYKIAGATFLVKKNTDLSQRITPVLKQEMDKVRSGSGAFLKSIAPDDPDPGLTDEQLFIVTERIEQLKEWKSVPANISSARANAPKLKELARSKKLKPQFLAPAALAELGFFSEDVLAKAEEMADWLEFSRGSKKADDLLLSIAFYRQEDKMRDILDELPGQNPGIGSRQIRTVWFFREKNKLTDEQFDRAVRFLALGTVLRDPEVFGINAEPLIFDQK